MMPTLCAAQNMMRTPCNEPPSRVARAALVALGLVLGVLGIVLLVIGLLMLRGGSSDSGSADGEDDDLVPAGNAPQSDTATQVLDDASKKPDNT